MALSLAIITYNEEENIVRLLDSLIGIADEIIIVDSFSTDRTKEICNQKYPQVKFFEKNLMGMANKKAMPLIYAPMTGFCFSMQTKFRMKN
jgi:glycosyltransferase involved in cell wall biosynthesis